MQVAVVDSDDFSAGASGGAQLIFVMNFNQRLKTKLARRRVKRAQFGLLQHRRDQQDTVGAGRARLVKLVGVENEILAQKRQIDRCSAPSANLQVNL